ncbi:MAG: glycosyltransferase family 4 protein [Candidatus Moranbacteria bacterium]|nr:glycosyltransferase family 4 protein [Candidatus Moranbacteria bacterium]
MSHDSEKKVKILMVAPTPFFADRGMHIRIFEEARAIVRRGHEVKIATYHNGNDIPEDENPGIDVRRIRRLLFWYRKLEAGPDWQKLVLDVLLIRKTYTLSREFRPDIVHAHNHEGVAIAWVALLLLRLHGQRPKLLADFQGSLTREMVSHAYLRGSWLRGIFRAVETWINDMSDAAVASSWSSAEEISAIRRGGVVEAVLDGARDLPDLPADDRKRFREKYGIGEYATVVVYTGAFIPNKGVEALVKAIPIALRSEPTLHFVLAGFPSNLLDPLLSKYGVRERVAVVSPLPYFSIGDVLGMSDIAIDPKHEDTGQASGKMLQYLGAGLPVVCFDTPNNRNYLGDGGTYAAEKTSDSLAEAIVTLARNRESWDHIGRANRLRAEGFTWDKTGEKLESIYIEILRKANYERRN